MLMKVINNKTQYALNNLVQLAKRENNTKRSYLLVNPLQAKHLPANATDTLNLFALLGNSLRQECIGRKTVVIGFAETATAIGASVAACFGAETLYFHTTREQLENATNLLDFEEEHSHATQQFLYATDGGQSIREAEQIVFVEDEVTTGKTILNFVEALRHKNLIDSSTKLAVASIVNSMSEEDTAYFVQSGICYHYLLKISADFVNTIFEETDSPFPQNIVSTPQTLMHHLYGKLDPRIGVKMDCYLHACKQLALDVAALLQKDNFSQGNILVLGTEEFMYPPILVAQHLAQTFCVSVKVHATTRSPIIPYNNQSYPLQNRSTLASLYEGERQTFVYNLQKYSKIIVLTDTSHLNDEGLKSLMQAVAQFGNTDVMTVCWEEKQ